MKSGALNICAGLAAFCLLLTANAYEASSDKQVEPRAQATTIPDDDWSTAQKESGHEFKCSATGSGSTGKILIGRLHDGDENDHTWYYCANVKQFEVLTGLAYEEVIENPLTNGTWFTCPENKVLIGRKHEGDEKQPEHLRCASVKDSWGNLMNVIPGEWSGPFQESDHQYKCPTNSVMIGKFHLLDENGITQYRCGTLW